MRDRVSSLHSVLENLSNVEDVSLTVRYDAGTFHAVVLSLLQALAVLPRVIRFTLSIGDKSTSGVANINKQVDSIPLWKLRWLRINATPLSGFAPEIQVAKSIERFTNTLIGLHLTGCSLPLEWHSPTNTHILSLRSVNYPLGSVPSLLQIFTNLTALCFVHESTATSVTGCHLLWDGLLQGEVQIRRLYFGAASLPEEFVHYLMDSSGLEELFVEWFGNRRDALDDEALVEDLFAVAVPNHKHTLKSLSICAGAHPHLKFGAQFANAVVECTELRNLRVTLHSRFNLHSTLLVHLMDQLPKLTNLGLLFKNEPRTSTHEDYPQPSTLSKCFDTIRVTLGGQIPPAELHRHLREFGTLQQIGKDECQWRISWDAKGQKLLLKPLELHGIDDSQRVDWLEDDEWWSHPALFPRPART
ncbi:hypothetical protein DL96DRAFT_1552718 [Flagelloscypha sp. PMI_526]|nr:hypothetical protein DL96DRAFT_1552718 [Flagelloscypha sp. PMI_526]